MDQSEVVDFLSSGRAFPSDDPVEIIETHGAYVFLSGTEAYKLKRAVTYDYMDLKTPELRHRMLVRELELNSHTAPQVYRDVVPVTQGPRGLRMGGEGQAIDWILRMWRFPAENEFDRIAERGDFDDPLALATGRALAEYHAKARVRARPGGPLIEAIVDELDRVFSGFPDANRRARVKWWSETVREAFLCQVSLLDERGRSGHVRRGHGDLHLRNLVLVDGRPTPFDALEFDEILGTSDVLYDIAFLIMDLCHLNLRRQACRVLDAWLREAKGLEDGGIAALPLFISVRAAIRAMVLLQTDAAQDRTGASDSEIDTYLALACDALSPPPPRLVAVGGFSGSGKSVLSCALAAEFGALPGAVILASDLERKVGHFVDGPLPAVSYSVDQRAEVYSSMLDRAATLLAGGHSVLLDATFIDPEFRSAAEDVANHARVPFSGFWLNVPLSLLETRLLGRHGDASDADVGVLHRQYALPLGTVTWKNVNAEREPSEVLKDALAKLYTCKPSTASDRVRPSNAVDRSQAGSASDTRAVDDCQRG